MTHSNATGFFRPLVESLLVTVYGTQVGCYIMMVHICVLHNSLKYFFHFNAFSQETFIFQRIYVCIRIRKGLSLNGAVPWKSGLTGHSVIIIREILSSGKVSRNLWFLFFLNLVSKACSYPAMLLILAILDAPA